MTDLANDWLEDEDAAEISKEDFADRIRLASLGVTMSGNYQAYYDDDDIFYGHSVTVSGNIKKGIKDVNIMG